MADTHVVSALKLKRAELAGRIEAAQEVVRQLVIDLDNVDATLRIFVPDIDLEEIRPRALPPRYHAYKGEVMRTCLNGLKNSREPMTTHQLSQLLLTERGVQSTDRRMLQTIVKRVGACMKNCRARGLVKARKGPGSFLLWSLAGTPMTAEKAGEWLAGPG